MASRSVAPVDWQKVRDDANSPQVFHDAHDFGSGDLEVTIPVRGPCDVRMLGVTRRCSKREWDGLPRRSTGELRLTAVHLHDAMRSDALSPILRRPTLSWCETTVLKWVAAGKSQQDVADGLGNAQHTVETYAASGPFAWTPRGSGPSAA